MQVNFLLARLLGFWESWLTPRKIPRVPLRVRASARLNPAAFLGQARSLPPAPLRRAALMSLLNCGKRKLVARTLRVSINRNHGQSRPSPLEAGSCLRLADRHRPRPVRRRTDSSGLNNTQG
jgi:hypothetical protein